MGLYKKTVRKSFKRFIGKHICRNLFLNKVAGLLPTIFFFKNVLYRNFHVNFAKYFTALFLQSTSGRLLMLRKTFAQTCSVKKVFLEISRNSQESTSVRVSFLIKLQALRRSQACNFIKKRLWRRCFPVNLAKFLRTPFLTEHLCWLLLY